MRAQGEGKEDMEQDTSTTIETSAAGPDIAARLRDVRWRELVGLRSIGFALARAWVYIMFIGAAASCVTWNGSPIPDVVFGISTVCLFLTMFLPAFRAKEFCMFMSKPHVRWAVPALLCSGTLAVVSSTLSGMPVQALCVYGGVATGVGSGLLDLGYGELYRNVPSRQTAFEAPFAFLLAAVVYFVSWWLPPVGACLRHSSYIELYPLWSFGRVVSGVAACRASRAHLYRQVCSARGHLRVPGGSGRRHGARSVHSGGRHGYARPLPRAVSYCLYRHGGHHLGKPYRAQDV